MAKIIVHLALIGMNNSLRTVLGLKSIWTALLLTRPWKIQAHDHTFTPSIALRISQLYCLFCERVTRDLRMNSLAL